MNAVATNLGLITELADVQRALNDASAELNMLHKLVEIRQCDECGGDFPAMINRKARFCSSNCKVKNHHRNNPKDK